MRRLIRRPIVSTVVLLTLAGAAVALHGSAAQERNDQRQPDAQTAAAEMPRAVVDTHQLMHLFNEPLYRYLKDAMQQEPVADPQWTTIQERGWQAAEVANLVALRNDSHRWRSLAANLQQAGIQLAKTAETHRWEPTQQSYRHLLQQCNACHQQMAPQQAPQLQP